MSEHEPPTGGFDRHRRRPCDGGGYHVRGSTSERHARCGGREAGDLAELLPPPRHPMSVVLVDDPGTKTTSTKSVDKGVGYVLGSIVIAGDFEKFSSSRIQKE